MLVRDRNSKRGPIPKGEYCRAVTGNTARVDGRIHYLKVAGKAVDRSSEYKLAIPLAKEREAPVVQLCHYLHRGTGVVGNIVNIVARPAVVGDVGGLGNHLNGGKEILRRADSRIAVKLVTRNEIHKRERLDARHIVILEVAELTLGKPRQNSGIFNVGIGAYGVVCAYILIALKPLDDRRNYILVHPYSRVGVRGSYGGHSVLACEFRKLTEVGIYACDLAPQRLDH